MTEDLVQWNQIKGLSRSRLDQLIADRQAAKEALAAVQESIDTIDNKILTALATADVKSVAVGETRVTLVPGGTSERLDKKKLWTRLLELGVKEKVVQKAYKDCTTTEPKEAYVLVTPPKKDKAA